MRNIFSLFKRTETKQYMNIYREWITNVVSIKGWIGYFLPPFIYILGGIMDIENISTKMWYRKQKVSDNYVHDRDRTN